MGIAAYSENHKLAQHLRTLRERHTMTLADLAERSGLSRSSLSRIENAEVSPTAETLGCLASVYGLPISQLLAPLEQGFVPVVKYESQSVWRDPKHDFERRSVSPPSGSLSMELIECTLGQGQRIAYDAPAFPGQEHHVYVLSGSLEITIEGAVHDLRAGDCLRYVLFGETVFKTGEMPCKYMIALS